MARRTHILIISLKLPNLVGARSAPLQSQEHGEHIEHDEHIEHRSTSIFRNNLI